MKIIVLVKQVPETDSLTLDPETGMVVRKEESAIVNPLDLYAIEAALRLKDADPGIEVTALSMGPPHAESALREAVAMGCDAAVLVTGREFGGSDTWATARALSGAVGVLGGAELLFCGEKATDGDTGQVGPELAAFLDIPVVSYVGAIASGAPGRPGAPGSLVAERVLEEGTQRVRVRFPALLTFCKAVGEPRLPELSGKRRARALQVRKLGFADLGLPAGELGLKGSPTNVVKVDRPRLTRSCRRMDARTEEGLAAACEAVAAMIAEAKA